MSICFLISLISLHDHSGHYVNACMHGPTFVGLKRCGKSCRHRYLHYLKPGIKRGNISKDEEDMIIKMHHLHGNR